MVTGRGEPSSSSLEDQWDLSGEYEGGKALLQFVFRVALLL